MSASIAHSCCDWELSEFWVEEGPKSQGNPTHKNSFFIFTRKGRYLDQLSFTSSWSYGTTWRMIHFCMCFDLCEGGKKGKEGRRLQICLLAPNILLPSHKKNQARWLLAVFKREKRMISCEKIHLAIKKAFTELGKGKIPRQTSIGKFLFA